MTVLDVGCGHRRIASRLAARGCQVTGLDSSTVFLDRARADAAALGVNVDYVAGDMRDLPWTEGFDRVVSLMFPKAVAKVTEDVDELIAFYDTWPRTVHLRATNPIESTLATVRHRTKVTKGPGSEAAENTTPVLLLIERDPVSDRIVRAPPDR